MRGDERGQTHSSRIRVLVRQNIVYATLKKTADGGEGRRRDLCNNLVLWKRGRFLVGRSSAGCLFY